MRISDWSSDVCSSDLGDALRLHQLARSDGLRYALFGDIDIPPAGEAVFEIPLRLAVADEDELGHFGSLRWRDVPPFSAAFRRTPTALLKWFRRHPDLDRPAADTGPEIGGAHV